MFYRIILFAVVVVIGCGEVEEKSRTSLHEQSSKPQKESEDSSFNAVGCTGSSTLTHKSFGCSYQASPYSVDAIGPVGYSLNRLTGALTCRFHCLCKHNLVSQPQACLVANGGTMPSCTRVNSYTKYTVAVNGTASWFDPEDQKIQICTRFINESGAAADAACIRACTRSKPYIKSPPLYYSCCSTPTPNPVPTQTPVPSQTPQPSSN